MIDQLSDPWVLDALGIGSALVANRTAIRSVARRIGPRHVWYCLLIPYLCPHR